MNIDQVCEAFLTSKEAANLSEATLDFYQRNVGAFVAWLAKSGYQADSWYNAATVEKYLASERRRKVSPYTVHARYRSLRVFFNWILERYHLPSPMVQVREPELPKRAPRKIELESVEKVIDAIPTGGSWTDARDRLLLLLFFWTGLRLEEMATLHVADVDIAAKLIHVRKGKGDKDRYVPLVPGAGTLLLQYLVSRPPWAGPELFLGNDGAGGAKGQIQPGGIRQMIRRRCEVAGVAYANPHAWRHGFAMTMLNSGGMEMGVLSKLLGHSSTKITQEIYADWVTDSLSREYQEAYRAVRSRQKP